MNRLSKLHRNTDFPENTGSNQLLSTDELDKILGDDPEPAKGTTSINQPSAASTVVSGSQDHGKSSLELEPDPDHLIYTSDDAPEDDSANYHFNDNDDADANPGRSTTGGKKTSDISEDDEDFARDFYATEGADFLSECTQMLCAYIAEREKSRKDAYTDEQKARIARAGKIWLKSFSFNPSPATTLLGVVGMATLPPVINAFAEKQQKKKMFKNAAQLGTAVTEALKEEKEVKPRTDFRIYATTGCYMKDKYGKMRNVETAKDRPDFANPDEVKALIKEHGLDKLKNIYPDVAQILEQFNNG